ncbi:PhzF family phenazine biosynthesis protein [Gordonia humi]|uniref:PhzF family phenazine biosynthesis protein n=1 Tax=Gordonia humi TaxID=686429 RepID=A0A840ETQ7_9ACTN|nr:PhzF family phenazine biosynthesis protein [Gordonia humi]MBB4136305.1 PhzF family phenazine biosynthesis protein [Gordonia humi]
MTDVLRMTAFPAADHGGNPAGVVLDASALDDAEMLAIAADVGYAETAFVRSVRASDAGRSEVDIRYFSPRAEVPFCGHATVATASVLAGRHGAGDYLFHTSAGDVSLEASVVDGEIAVSFTSVEPRVRDLDDHVLADLLDALGLTAADLDPRFPARESFAGNWHPVLVVGDRDVFDQFRFWPPTVAAFLDENGWAGTITVLHDLGDGAFAARNLFPVGRITEDPATGSSAASTGAYLRAIDRVPDGGEFVIRQGEHVGRPSLLRVRVPASGGIVVTGTARRI